MAFWIDGKQAEPKRQHRWLIRIPDIAGAKIESFYASKCTKPKMSTNVAEHKYLGHTFKFPGNVTWNDIEAEFVDVDQVAAAILIRLFKSGYHPPLSPTDVTTMSKDKAIAALGLVQIVSLGSGPTGGGDVAAETFNPTGPATELDTWTLHNAWIKDADFSALDYSSDEVVKIPIVIAYDFPSYEDSNGNKLWSPDKAESE